LLTDSINKTPHAVLVLDEIEKAHPDLFNILLQVMDHATLTDNNGKKADFRNVILIMTTNAGAREMATEDVGFKLSAAADKPSLAAAGSAGEDASKQSPLGFMKGKDAIERTFSPEFRNRLDAWIRFNQLHEKEIVRVVNKFVTEVSEQLTDKKVTLEISETASAWLAKEGFSKLYGARPMGRLVQQKIREPLAEELLFGKLQNGGTVVVDVKDGKLVLNVEEAPPAQDAPSKAESAPAPEV
jgi:ATP-dependent Clp protease ATP-binding subunit ClpA